METKICNKCGIEKELNLFEYRREKNIYRNTCKECRNKIRRDKYKLKKSEINQKRREYYLEHKEEYNLKRKNRNNDPISKLKKQLTHSIDKAYERKGFLREDSYEEILGCSIEKMIDHLLFSYKAHYKKEWDGKVKVEIDHIKPIWPAKSKEQLKKLCKSGNLQLLTKEDNHIKSGKISNGIEKNGKVKYIWFDSDSLDY